MARLTAYLLLFALGAGAAVALASCGSSGSTELLPGNSARQISENLDQVKQLAAQRDCVGAEAAAQQVSEQIDELGGVDKQLKQALRDGAAKLNEVLEADCSPEPTEALAPATVAAPEENEEEEEEQEEAPKAKKPAHKAPPSAANVAPNTTTPTTTAPPAPATTPTTPPVTEAGGTGAPAGGVSPETGGGE